MSVPTAITYRDQVEALALRIVELHRCYRWLEICNERKRKEPRSCR